MQKISFIIVNYNTKDLLDKCVEGLLGIFEPMEIIVVDNGSSDGSIELVQEKYASSVSLVLSENKGLAHGQNLGMAASSGDYLVFLGTDAYPTKEAIAKMYDYMEHNPQVGIVTPRLVLRDGSIDMDAHRGLMTPWSALTHFAGLDRLFPKSVFFNGYFRAYQELTSIHPIDACISHFMFTRKAVFTKIGTWDEEFFLFGEDIDICYRTKEAGFEIMYMGTVDVLHYKGGTIVRKTSKDMNTGIKKDITLRRRITQQSVESMGHFYKKHLWKKYPLWLSLLVSLGVFLLTQLRLVIFDLKHLLKQL